MSSNHLVTIVTATTGNPLLPKNIESVINQTYDRIQHLVVVDGDHKVEDLISPYESPNLDVIRLPYATGINRFNGHRIYGACTYLAEGEYIMFLDDDNSLTPEHVEKCMEKIKTGKDWTFSFRNIVDKDQNLICRDDCESLGHWPSILDPQDFFVDVNCYFLHRPLALCISPVWFRKFREPGQMEIDRAIFSVLNQICKNFETTGEYSVNYTVGNSPLSVQKEFFIEGNKKMLERHGGRLPWVK